MFGFIVAVLDVIALAIIGVPLFVTWGVLTFVTNYIPNIGFILGVIPPALIALLDGGVGSAVAVVAAYTAINVVVQTIIQPRFTGDAVGISATVLRWEMPIRAVGPVEDDTTPILTSWA